MSHESHESHQSHESFLWSAFVASKVHFSLVTGGSSGSWWQLQTHRIHGAAIYGNIYHQYTPNVSIYIYHTWILWERVPKVSETSDPMDSLGIPASGCSAFSSMTVSCNLNDLTNPKWGRWQKMAVLPASHLPSTLLLFTTECPLS